MGHAIVNGDDVDAGLSEHLQNTLQFVLGHREVAFHQRAIIRPGECRPRVHPISLPTFVPCLDALRPIAALTSHLHPIVPLAFEPQDCVKT